MWMFLCLLPFPVSISPSLSLCLSPLSVSFLRFGPPTAAAGKVLSPFLLLPYFLPPHSQCHTSVSVPSITFDLFPFWPLFYSEQLLHTNLNFISQISDMGSEGILLLAVKSQENIICCRKCRRNLNIYHIFTCLIS